MSGRMPSPSQGAKPCREVGADEAGPAGSLGRELARIAPRRRGRGRSRSASPRARAAAAIAAGVAAGAEGAVDRDLPRLGASSAISSAARTGSCSVGIIDHEVARRPAWRSDRRLLASGSHLTRRSGSRPGPRRSRGRRRRAPPPAWPRPRRSRSPGTRRRRSRRRGRRGRRARSAAWGRGCARPSRASRRRSRRGSGGAGCARRVPKGLCGERKRSESCSNSAVVCTQTQGSKPLERTTAVRERGAEARGNREAILGVETVLVETPKSHPRRFLSGGRPGKS